MTGLWMVLRGHNIEGFIVVDGDTVKAADERVTALVGKNRADVREWASRNGVKLALAFGNVEMEP